MACMNAYPLNSEELDHLDDFLATIDGAMNIERLDGYFVALICSPDTALPSEYLPYIWGEDFSFSSHEEAQNIVELLMRHWNTISDALFKTLKKDDLYFPILLQGDDGVAYGNDWAQGFLQGVDMHRESWADLVNDEERGGSLIPIMMLAHEHDPDPEMRPPPISPEKREEILQYMIGGLTHIYRYFAPYRHRQAQSVSNQRRVIKLGRNDPCPCGSGKKYKHCCIDSKPTLH